MTTREDQARGEDMQRDSQLAALLRVGVEAPPLRPGFHDELEARLQAAGAAVTRVPARRRVKPLRLLTAAAVAAAAAVFAFAVLPALRGGDTATAGDVLAAMTAASGGAQTVRLHMVSTVAVGGEGGAPENRSSEKADLTLSIAGDSLALLESTSTWKDSDGVWHSVTSSHTTGYDQNLHESRAFFTAGTAQKGMTIRRPAWQTDSAALDGDAERYPSLTANLRAAVAAADPSLPVEETTCLGRPAWHGVFIVREQWGMDGELAMVFRWDATVDQATGLLVAASCTVEANGKSLPWEQELHITSLEVDPALDPGWQRPEAPGRKTVLVDDGTRFGTPEEVAELSWPTLPLIPQWAPAGYRLTDVASAGAGTGPMSVARSSRGVVVKRVKGTPGSTRVLVRFRGGFGSFVVEISPKTLGQTVDGEPDVVLGAGYLEGQPAVFGDDASDGTQIGISAPTLITYSDRSKIVITGDLTRDELVKVAESMKVYGDEDRPLMPGFGQ